jgi:hypothetical protein
MHPVIYPDNRNDESNKLVDYILQICQEHKAEDRAVAFAFIISDLHNPHVNKILRDVDYMNALHKISGKYLTVFFLNDHYVDKTITTARNSNVMRFELSVEPINAPPNITPKQLANVLIEEEILSSPSILFFQVDNSVVTDFFITKLRENKIEDGFLEIKDIITVAVNSFSDVKQENRKNHNELFSLLKQSIESSEFWKNTKKNYEKLIKIKDFLYSWK